MKCDSWIEELYRKEFLGNITKNEEKSYGRIQTKREAKKHKEGNT